MYQPLFLSRMILSVDKLFITVVLLFRVPYLLPLQSPASTKSHQTTHREGNIGALVTIP
jgi:hypothetical protein